MTTLISQIMGCLLVAAGIGGVVGWILRHLSVHQLTQQFREVATSLRYKGQLLEKAQHELKDRAAAMSALESKMADSAALDQSNQQKLAAQQNRLQELQQEAAVRAQRLKALEANEASVRRRANEYDTAAAAQAEEARQLHLARQNAERTRVAREQERQNLQRRIIELEARVVDTDQLRARVEELEPAQGRVHWLEVQLCDRDTEHRSALHQLEIQLADRDRRIEELERLEPHLKDHEAALTEREKTYEQTLAQQEAQIAKLHRQLAAHDKLSAQLLLDEQLLRERDERIDALQQQIQALADQSAMVAGKEEEITRLRKRLVEVRAALRIKTDGTAAAARPVRQNGNQLSLQMEQANTARAEQKDDLSRIHGIGPVFARTLNKMGMRTYIQIARWKPEDIVKVAKKLYTAPERIKRDKWIDEAKKLHAQKYGERL